MSTHSKIEQLEKRISFLEQVPHPSGCVCGRCMDRYYIRAKREPDKTITQLTMEKEHWEQEKANMPLDARVAKALGWQRIKFQNHRWSGAPPTWIENTAYRIPFYSTDLKLAMEALEEYCKGRHLFWELCWLGYTEIHIGPTMIYSPLPDSDEQLPESICEAIVAHAGKDQVKPEG